jgi:hypothetical protein
MQLNIVAYAADCRVLGRLQLDAERMSDLLNHAHTYELTDAVFESLEDGHRVELAEYAIAAEDVHVVEVVGPRGDPGRRVRTRLHRMQLKVGPYVVAGHLHMLPGVDPLAGFVRRGRFVALTEITLGYQAGREWVLRDVEAIVVNRDLVEWIQPATDESTAFPDVPIKADPRAKELAWGLAR